MLKKLSHIILSLLLLVTTMGMAVSKHYCQGDLMSVSLFGQDKHACDMGSCCHNETHIYQVKDDFSAPTISTPPVLAELDILGHDLFALADLSSPETEDSTPFISETPPSLPQQKALAFKQVYLL